MLLLLFCNGQDCSFFEKDVLHKNICILCVICNLLLVFIFFSLFSFTFICALFCSCILFNGPECNVNLLQCLQSHELQTVEPYCHGRSKQCSTSAKPSATETQSCSYLGIVLSSISEVQDEFGAVFVTSAEPKK